jgi:hypothetical protein
MLFALNVTALAVVLVGVLLLVLPSTTSLPAVALPVPAVDDSSVGRPAPAVADSLAEEIVLANLFSPTRSPPLRRVMPPELAGDSVNGMLADRNDPDSTESAAADTMPAIPRLYGTMVGLDGARALLHLDASSAGPVLYGVGESAGGYRVLSITPREVTLAGPRGRTVLRLPLKEERP